MHDKKVINHFHQVTIYFVCCLMQSYIQYDQTDNIFIMISCNIYYVATYVVKTSCVNVQSNIVAVLI